MRKALAFFSAVLPFSVESILRDSMGQKTVQGMLYMSYSAYCQGSYRILSLLSKSPMLSCSGLQLWSAVHPDILLGVAVVWKSTLHTALGWAPTFWDGKQWKWLPSSRLCEDLVQEKEAAAQSSKVLPLPYMEG